MVALYKDPEGNNIFDRADVAVAGALHSNSNIALLNMSDDSHDKETIVHLRKRIKELESALSQSKSS